MLDADEPQTSRRERWIGIRVQDQTLPLVSGLSGQLAIVERIGYEPAQIRVHPSRLAEEDAAPRAAPSSRCSIAERPDRPG